MNLKSIFHTRILFLQAEFSKLYAVLQSKENVKTIGDITLKLRDAPLKPSLPLADSIQRAFSVIHMHFMKMMPRIPNMQQPQPLMHPVLGQPMFIQNSQQAYMMNSGYSYPRNRLPYSPQQAPQPLPAQPGMSPYTFPRQGPPNPSNNGSIKITNSVCSTIGKCTIRVVYIFFTNKNLHIFVSFPQIIKKVSFSI